MTEGREGGDPVTADIGEGLRAWYSACRCCLTDAHPGVVARLDAERRGAGEPVAGPGICEVAEGKAPGPER